MPMANQHTKFPPSTPIYRTITLPALHLSSRSLFLSHKFFSNPNQLWQKNTFPPKSVKRKSLSRNIPQRVFCTIPLTRTHVATSKGKAKPLKKSQLMLKTRKLMMRMTTTRWTMLNMKTTTMRYVPISSFRRAKVDSR